MNEIDRAKIDRAAEKLTALGYRVVSSGYTHVMVDIGTDSHRIVRVHHAQIDEFLRQSTH